MAQQSLASGASPRTYGSVASLEASVPYDEPAAVSDAWAHRPAPTYRRLLLVHACIGVPASIALLAAALALARYGWHGDGGEVRGWMELGIGAAAWLATEGLREPLFDLVVRLPTRALAPLVDGNAWMRWPGAVVSPVAPLALHAASHEAVRLAAVALSAQTALPTADDDATPPLAFFRSLYIALGWTTAECAVRAIRLLLHHLPLYREVLEPLDDTDESFGPCDHPAESALSPDGVDIGPIGGLDDQGGDAYGYEDELDEDEEDLVDATIRARQRIELELRYGAPLSHLPVVFIILHSLNSILLALALTPWLYMGLPSERWSQALTPVLPLGHAFLIAVVAHALLSALWSHGLARFGVAAIATTSTIASSTLLFASWLCCGAIV